MKPQIRRTRSSQEDAKGEIKLLPDDEEDEEGEEEVTRCICGNQEYPGMPVPVGDTPKVNPKSNGPLDPSIISAPLPEDAGGLFIQCDICKVWQHGGCVGIMDEAMSPEEYFCEECRDDLHKLTSTATGQKYSRYLPVQEITSFPSSPSLLAQDTFATKPKTGRASRANAESLGGKRRSTMNSRDAAYDEDHNFQRVLEASLKEGEAPGTSIGTRRGKRSRSDSEQRKEDTKRQRTGSDSSSLPSDSKTLLPNADSDEDADQPTKAPAGSYKKMRGAAARNHRDKEIRDREEKRERERADAAGRRKGRAERRRGDDSDHSEVPLSRTTSSKGAEPPLPAITSHPPPPVDHPPPKPSHHKKTGRPPARRGRVGRNQYTKDRDPRPSDPIHPDNSTSPPRSQSHSRDTEDRPLNPNGSGHSIGNGAGGSSNGWTNSHNHENGKPSKPRHMNPNRTTMNDMKRRVSGILEFVSRTQVEMATAAAAAGDESTAASRNRTRTHSSSTTVMAQDSGKVTGLLDGNGNSGGSDSRDPIEETLGLNLETFSSLSSVEMMEVLTRGLMKWQGEFGKAGEK